MDQLDPNDAVEVPGSKATEVPAVPPPPPHDGDAPESLGHATPAGLRSSPPPLRAPAHPFVTRDTSNVESMAGSQSDSEAETVVLPGVDGYSPSKIRKERNIKLEDRGADFGQDRAGESNALRGGEANVDDTKQENALPTENAASLLGKRKRSKHGMSRLDVNHGGNSSGLSSVPTSPVAHTRSNLGKRIESESEGYRSSSPRKAGPDKASKNKRSTDSNSDRDKEFKRTHARRSSARDTSGIDRYGDRRTKVSGEPSTRRRRTHSPSPTRERDNTDLFSGHRSASSGAANGLGNRKKSIPPPLRSTKSNHSADQDSEDSSAIESTRPRRSKTRHQGTPPTGGSIQKMGHRRKANRYGRTALADATEAGNLEKTKQLLAEFPEDLDVPDAAGNTPLQCAALNGHAEIVKLLLMHGCAIDCKNNDGDSPLLDAVENGHLEVVNLLLNAGVDPRARNQRGEEPLVMVNEEHKHADEIKGALQAAKAAHAAKFRPSDSAHTPQQESIESTNRKFTSQGRANRTAQSMLYTSFDIPSLRDAAAKGETERVVSILGVLGNVDDAEATLGAAKGGHIDALEMMFGLGNANPDPDPVDSAPSWEFATPMLAAIGGDNTKVVQLLLQQAKDKRFNPTKRFKGKTYFEIARERAGPVWMEEERLLKEAYDEYASRSPVAARSNGSGKKLDENKHTRAKSSRSDARGPDMSSPVRRGPGRPRKDNNDDAEHETQATISHKDDEVEQTKPRRKLVSGRELKDAAHEKSKPASSTTGSPPKSERAASISQRKPELAGAKKSTHLSDRMEGIESTSSGQDRSRRDKSSDRAAARDSSPTKRLRRTSPTPSEPAEMGTKRRRTESETKKRRQSDVGQGTAAEKRIPAGINKDRGNKEKPSSASLSVPRESSARRDSIDPPAVVVENTRPTRSSPGKVRPKPPPVEDTTQYLGQKRKTAVELEAEVKSVITAATAKRREADRQNDETARKSDAEKKAEAEAEAKRLEEERERKRADIARRREHEARLAALHADAAPETTDLIEPGNLFGIRKARQAVLDLVINREDNARRELEEAELRERQRREASAQRHRDEELRAAQRAAEEEQKRLQREEMENRQQAERERRRREKNEEIARLKKEREDARLAKLPPLLRWWETAENVATREIAKVFSTMYAARYDTIVIDEAKRDPNIDNREQYILNTHAAFLLGEKDLELTRYTGWERLPASKWALHGYWRLDSDKYAMIWPGLDVLSPDISHFYIPTASNPKPSPDFNAIAAVRRAARPLFLDLPLHFVRLSDVMFVVPKKAHLRDLEMVVYYHEALPDESFALDFRKRMEKWRGDPGADLRLGWCPGPWKWVNGACVEEVRPRVAVFDRKMPVATPLRAALSPRLPNEGSQQTIQQPSQQQHERRPEVMEVDAQIITSSPAAPAAVVPDLVAPVRHPLPANLPTYGGTMATSSSALTSGNFMANAEVANANANASTSSSSMANHFAGEFAGYSMQGAGSGGGRPSESAGGFEGERGVN